MKTHVLNYCLFFFLFFTNQLYAANCTYPTSAANNYIGNWNATINGQPIYDPLTNTTEFSYTLSGQCNNLSLCTGNTKTGKNLSHWVIALEDGIVVKHASASCVLNATTSVGHDPTTGLYGLKYDDGQILGTTCVYKFQLEGPWGAELGHYAAKAGSNQISDNTAFGCTYIPAESKIVQTYKISGTAYIDVNRNNVLDSEEPKINDVKVTIEENNTTLTDSNGAYLFSGLKPGTYVLNNSLNAALEQYLIENEPGTFSITVGPDAKQDLSYNLNFQAILDDLNPNDPDYDGFNLLGEGKTIGFWKHQLNVLLTGKGKAQVSREQLLGIIASTNNFYLQVPFYPLSIQTASDILSYNGPDAKSLLLKQLLAAEFNRFYGIGLQNAQLGHLILTTAEVYAQYSSQFTREELLKLKDILDKMNNLSLVNQ